MKLRKPHWPGNGVSEENEDPGLCFVCGKVERLGSVGFPCSSLQPCHRLLHRHQHIVFQRGSVFVKIPICLGSLFLREAAGLKIWEALGETT